jgi:YD repeat-containing protein
VSQVTLLNSVTGNQTTQFLYGTTLSDSAVASNLLKRAEVYPDSADSNDRVTFKYNRQGQVTEQTDQNGTTHAYVYDALGRPTQDRVTTLGTGIDGAVRRVGTTYEVRGLIEKVTSYDNATVGLGSVVREVQRAYNSFSQLTTEYQAHAGAVNTGTTPKCQYGYANGSANHIRLTSLTYLNGRVLTVSYGTTDGINDAMSRIAALIDNDGTTHLADYAYLGEEDVIEVDL